MDVDVQTARTLLRAWLSDLTPEQRRSISAAGVEYADGGLRFRVGLRPGRRPDGFPANPEGLRPIRYYEGEVFRRF